MLTILVNKYQKTNGIVISAYRTLSLYTYNNILGKIKDKLLNIFKELERNYGNLDELYVDFSDINKRDKDIFSGYLKCADCGKSLIIKKSKNYEYY